MQGELFDEAGIQAGAAAIGIGAMDRILRLFARTCAEQCDDIKDLLQMGQFVQAQREAHSVAGAAANCSAIALAAQARQIEHTDQPDVLQAETLCAIARASAQWIDSELHRVLRA